jgi:hypothetical protein
LVDEAGDVDVGRDGREARLEKRFLGAHRMCISCCSCSGIRVGREGVDRGAASTQANIACEVVERLAVLSIKL